MRRSVTLIATAVLGGVTGALLASAELRTAALDTLAIVGGAYRVQYESSVPDSPDGKRRSEYLVVLREDVEPSTYFEFFDTDPDMEYLSDSIYPRTIRVSLPVPVGASLETLEAQPFARFVVRNLPILFFH